MADRYPLSGIVYCGHCGRRMHGTIKIREKGGKRYTYEKFVCQTYANGVTAFGCRYVDQRELLAFLLTKLREAVLAGGHRDELRAIIRERLETRQKVAPQEVEALQRKLADLERQIKTGTERLLKSPE